MLDKEKGIKCYVDANFSGGWAQLDFNKVEKFMSRLRYVVLYAVCPIFWYSKLQMEFA